MNNRIFKKGWSLKDSHNHIHLDRLAFKKEKEKHQVVKKQLQTNKEFEQVVEHIKKYLIQDKHRELLRGSFGNDDKKSQLKIVISNYISSNSFLSLYSSFIADYSLEETSDILVERIAGLDILEPLVKQKTITDIRILSFKNIWVDDIYQGKYKTTAQFRSKEDYLELINKFAFASNTFYSYSKPSVDAVFPFMRVNFVGHDLSDDITTEIRLVSKKLRLSEPYIEETGYATKQMMQFLGATTVTESHLFCGATGTGKTELLRYLVQYMPDHFNVLLIEDTPETYLPELYPKKCIASWKNRVVIEENEESFGYLYHIRNALRHNIDVLIIQESRGKESALILKAAETGHIVNTTLHSESALDAPVRFIDLCQEAQHHPDEFYGKRIVRSFRIGVSLRRYGKVRRIQQIVEYTGYKNGELQANVLFEYDEKDKCHKQVHSMSEKLWLRLSETCEDMSHLETLKPEHLKVGEKIC